MKMLIIRSARMELVDKALDFLKTNFTESKVSVLAQPGVKDELEKDSRVDEVFLYEKGFFNLFKIGPKLFNKLRKKRFDSVVILYNNPVGEGYFHVEAISLLIKPRKIFIYDIKEKFYEMTIFRWVYRLTVKTIIHPLHFLISFFILGFLLIFVLVPVYILRKTERLINFLLRITLYSLFKRVKLRKR